MRKHWSSYPPEEVCYGNWHISNGDKSFSGFGVYSFDHLGTKDVWIDKECATPKEMESYKEYCKLRGFDVKETT